MGRCERCGGKFDFEGCCEICGGDDEWTWNTPKNTNKIVCEGCGTEIYEVRRHCHVCGRANRIAYRKEGKYYCPCCGIPFEDDECPSCGKSLQNVLSREIRPVDKRYCSRCKKEVSRNDFICVYCGNDHYLHKPLKEEDLKPKEKKERSPLDYHCPGCGGDFDFDGFCWKCGIERYKVSCRKLKPEEVVTCPRCKEQISKKDKFCPICGNEVKKSAAEAPRIKEDEHHVHYPKEEKTVIHAKIPEHSKETYYKPTEHYRSENTTLWLILGIISLVICCMPTGIGTIICSIGAKTAENDGNYYLLHKKMVAAKIWFFVSVAIILALMAWSVVIQAIG